MPSASRAFEIGSRRATRHQVELGAGLEERRLEGGLSQQHVAGAARMSRFRYGRIERGQLSATVLELDRLAVVLGLDLSIRLYPGGAPVRDAAQAVRLGRFLARVRPPLSYGIEVALPQREGRPDQRAWDAVLFGAGSRTAIELETRVRDVQAMRRRHDLKLRDDPTEGFLLLIADTRHNRRVIAELASLFGDLPRLRCRTVFDDVERGRHPPTGMAFV